MKNRSYKVSEDFLDKFNTMTQIKVFNEVLGGVENLEEYCYFPKYKKEIIANKVNITYDTVLLALRQLDKLELIKVDKYGRILINQEYIKAGTKTIIN